MAGKLRKGSSTTLGENAYGIPPDAKVKVVHQRSDSDYLIVSWESATMHQGRERPFTRYATMEKKDWA